MEFPPMLPGIPRISPPWIGRETNFGWNWHGIPAYVTRNSPHFPTMDWEGGGGGAYIQMTSALTMDEVHLVNVCSVKRTFHNLIHLVLFGHTLNYAIFVYVET